VTLATQVNISKISKISPGGEMFENYIFNWPSCQGHDMTLTIQYINILYIAGGAA